MFMTTFFPITKRWKIPLEDEGINDMCDIHTMEYYVAIKNNEVLVHAAIRLKLQNILLSEGGREPARQG